jgi:hypothetical protein
MLKNTKVFRKVNDYVARKHSLIKPDPERVACDSTRVNGIKFARKRSASKWITLFTRSRVRITNE